MLLSFTSVNFVKAKKVSNNQKHFFNSETNLVSVFNNLDRVYLTMTHQFPRFLLSGDQKVLSKFKNSYLKFNKKIDLLISLEHNLNDKKILTDIKELRAKIYAHEIIVANKRAKEISIKNLTAFDSEMSLVKEIPLIELLLHDYDMLKVNSLLQSQTQIVETAKTLQKLILNLGYMAIAFFFLIAFLLRKVFLAKKLTEKLFLDKYAQEQKISKARKEAVEIVAHDIRSPLGSILSASELLVEEIRNSPMQNSGLLQLSALISSSTRRISQLVTNILDNSKIERGILELQYKPFKLNEFLKEMNQDFTNQAELSDIKLSFNNLSKEIDIFADKERLYQVFSNIIGNSLKFTPRGGKIDVSTILKNDHVVLTFTDNGVGISSKDLGNLFMTYWQKEENTRSGLGMGMKIVNDIITAHQGEVNVESTEGKGTKVKCKIPLYPKYVNKVELPNSPLTYL